LAVSEGQIVFLVNLPPTLALSGLHSRRIGGHADVQVGELSKHFTIFRTQTLDEGGIVELGLTVLFAQVAKRVQALQDGLTSRRGHLLPARKQSLADISLLLGSHLLPHALPVAQRLLLIGSQSIPGFEAPANLRLLFRRQTQKTLVVPQELFLPGRRHILKPFDSLRR
jgi:hypothetical protein